MFGKALEGLKEAMAKSILEPSYKAFSRAQASLSFLRGIRRTERCIWAHLMTANHMDTGNCPGPTAINSLEISTMEESI